MTTSLTVYRTGRFNVALPAVKGKCGHREKKDFLYEVWFTAGENALDERGFIVDNADIHKYFEVTYGAPTVSVFASCERMGLKAVADLSYGYPVAEKIVVRIWGLEGITYVETKWEAE